MVTLNFFFSLAKCIFVFTFLSCFHLHFSADCGSADDDVRHLCLRSAACRRASGEYLRCLHVHFLLWLINSMPRHNKKYVFSLLEMCRICLDDRRHEYVDVMCPNEPHLLQHVKDYYRVEVSIYVVRAYLSRFFRIILPFSCPADLCLYRHYITAFLLAAVRLDGPLCCCVIFVSLRQRCTYIL